jgi:hypothetical protein
VIRTALTALLLAATAAPPAAAQEDGVFVDPDSPAGVEYAIPLQEARRQAAGGRRADPGSGRPLFGEGIERAPGPASRSDGGGSSDQGGSHEGGGALGGAGGAQRKGGEDASLGARDIPPSSAHSAAIEAAAADGSDGLLTAGVAASVLAAGLLARLLLRRLLRSRDTLKT